MSAIDDAVRAAGGAPPRIMPRMARRPAPIMATRRTTARRRPSSQAARFMQAKQHEEGRSIIGQFSDIVSGLPAGLVGLGRDVAVTASAPARIPFDMARGKATRGEFHKYLPFLADTGESIEHTVGRLTNLGASLAPGGLKPSQSEYAKASRKSGIVGTLIEDVGNAALFGAVATGGASVAAARTGAESAAAKAAAESAVKEAASASVPKRVFVGATDAAEMTARYSPRVEQLLADARAAKVKAAKVRSLHEKMTGATRALDIAGDAPARVFTTPAKYAYKAAKPVLRPAVERLGETATGQAVKAAFDAHALGREQTARARRVGIDPMNEETLGATREVSLLTRQTQRGFNKVAKRSGYSSEALIEAQILRQNKIGLPLARALREVEKIGGRQMRDEVIREAMGIETAVSDEAINVLLDELDGKLDPKVIGGMEKAWSWTQRLIDEREQARLVGEGRIKGPLSEEQLGDEPMPTAVEHQLRPFHHKVDTLYDEIEDTVHPHTREKIPGLRSQVGDLIRAAEERKQRAFEQGIVPPSAVAHVERVARRQGGADTLHETATRLRQWQTAPVAEPRMPSPERVFGPVERSARAEGRLEGRADVGEELLRRAQQAHARAGTPETPREFKRAAEAGRRAEEAGVNAEQARQKIASQMREGPGAPTVGRWWDREGHQHVPEGSPITKADRDEVQAVVNGMAEGAYQHLREAADIDYVGQESLPPIPDETWRTNAGPAHRGAEWDWVETLSNEERTAYEWAVRQKHGADAKWRGQTADPLDPRVVAGGPDQWESTLDVHSQEEAVRIVMGKVRSNLALEQLSRGIRPWFESDLPFPLTAEEEAIIRALPTEPVQGFHARRARNGGAYKPGRRSWGKGAGLPGIVDSIRRWRNEGIDTAGPNPGIGPWTHMSEEEWSAALDDLGEQHLAASEADAGSEWGSDDLDRLTAEIEAMAPSAFWRDQDIDRSELYRRLREQTARHHPEAIEGGPAATSAVSDADMDAVATAEVRAYDAFYEDQELEAQGDKTAPGFQSLANEEKALYIEFVEQLRHDEAKTVLARAREKALVSLRKGSPWHKVEQEGERIVKRSRERPPPAGKVVTEESPLPYPGAEGVQRMALYADKDLPASKQTYFADNPRLIGFVDFSPSGRRPGETYIHFMSTRTDRGGEGVARRLLDKLYKSTDEAMDWGEIHHDAAGRLWTEFTERYPDRGNFGKPRFDREAAAIFERPSELDVQRGKAADTMTAAGARRGRQEGERTAAGTIASDLADRAARQDRQLNPVVGRTPQDVARAALEERIQGTAFRQGEYTGRLQRDAQIGERELRRKEGQLERARERLAREEARLAKGPAEVVPGKDRGLLYVSKRIQKSLYDRADALTAQVAQDAGEAVDGWAKDFADIGDPEAAAAALTALGETLPQNMEEMHAAGLFPQYLPGGFDEPLGGGFVGGAEDQLPKLGITTAEQMKRKGRTPKRVTTIARSYVDESKKLAQNKAVDRIVEDGLAQTGAALIESELRGKVPDDVVDALMSGRTAEKANDIGHALARAGYTAWDPEAPFSGKPPSAIDLNTLFLPTPVFKAFRRWFSEKEASPLVKYGIDKPTTVWKHAVLALNPYWQIGNAVGNAMMATIAGGVPPHVLVREGWKALKMLTEEGSVGPVMEKAVRYMAKDLEDRRGDVLFPARLYDAGTAADSLRALADGDPELGRMMRFVQGSYNLNNFVDNLGRSTVYLAKKGKGMSDEQAVQATLRAMGDFSRMSAVEKNVVRRIMPFWAFQRHVLQMSWRLPLHHPFRVAATLHLANMNRPEMPEGTPDMLKGAYPMGGDKFFNMSAFNPFTAGMSTLTTGEGNPVAEFTRSINPVAQAGLAIGAGFNTKQFRPMTRPKGSGHFDSEGRPVAGPLAPSEAAWYLSQQIPQTRALTSIFGKNDVRYDTGDPMVIGGRKLRSESPRHESIIRNLGIPFPMTVPTSDRARRAAARRRQNQRDRDRYARSVG